MVSTRSRTTNDINTQIAAIDQACAARQTKQTAITEFFVSVVARSTVVTQNGTADNGTVTESAVSVSTSSCMLTTTPGSVGASKNDVALQINLQNQHTNVTSSSEEGLKELLVEKKGESPSAPKESSKGRGKKRQSVAKVSSSKVTKKVKVSKTKTIKVKKEELDEDFLPKQTELIPNELAQSGRRMLRPRPRRRIEKKAVAEASIVDQGHPTKIVVLRLDPMKLTTLFEGVLATKRSQPTSTAKTGKATKSRKVPQATPKRKPIFRRPRNMPYTNKYQFAFGEDRLPKHAEPTAESIQQVAKIMELERMDLAKSGKVAPGSATPFHAGKGISVESVVRVILSQVCTNEKALDIQATMRQAYPYWVNGEKFIGMFPNYHSMRVQSLEKLEKVIRDGGLNFKAKSIKGCLDIIYAKNVARIPPGAIEYAGNEPFATDFVPGLLSMDYLRDIHQQGGKQAVFDNLVQLPQIAVKSASCLMAFNMGLPVFAVDTHVEGMAKLLG
ncbi:hypothetical protein LTS17_008983 [Exophiala oligosperma]